MTPRQIEERDALLAFSKRVTIVGGALVIVFGLAGTISTAASNYAAKQLKSAMAPLVQRADDSERRDSLLVQAVEDVSQRTQLLCRGLRYDPRSRQRMLVVRTLDSLEVLDAVQGRKLRLTSRL